MARKGSFSQVYDKNGDYADVEAVRFDGTRTVNIQGDVTATQTWNGDSNTALTLNASIGAKKVTQDKIGDKAVGSGQMADESVGFTQIDPNVYTNTVEENNTKLVTSGGVNAAIQNAILNRGIDYGPKTVDEINALSNIPTGSTVHVSALGSGDARVVNDGWKDGQHVSIQVRVSEDLTYYTSGNDHGWYSNDGEFKLKQQAYSASGLGALKTITSLSQDENGVITATASNIQSASTSQAGVVQLNDATNSTSTTQAATANSVKSAYDLANGKYSKPSGGIPKTDLASGVQGSLDKADSAVQGVKLAGASSVLTPDASKVVTIPNVAPTGTGETNGLMTAADKKKLDDLTPQADMTDRMEAIAEALCDLDARTVANEEAVNAENLGDRTADSLDAQVLKMGGEDLADLLGGKVDKEAGKGLSTNDFTDTYKSNVDANTQARHSHSNQTVLDGISSNDIAYWNAKQDSLDFMTDTDVDNLFTAAWNAANS